MRALIVLTQTESKRIIAKGMKKHPKIKEALKEGKIFVARGSTNAYVLEELLDKTIEKNHYVAGQMTDDKEKLFRYASVDSKKRLPEIIIEQGKPREITATADELKNFTPEDVMIKGGNVLGDDWVAGVYIAHPIGGTIGAMLPIANSRGVPIIAPISLAKMAVEGTWQLSQILGNQTFDEDYVMGYPIGVIPIPGEVFTELEAFDLLYPDVNFYHIGSGGVGGAEGSVHFLLNGSEEKVKQAYKEIVELIQNEDAYIPDLD